MQRTYPTLLDTFSDIGGLLEVLTFIIYLIMSFHHDIVLEQYVLNQAVLQKNKSSQEKEFQKSKTVLTLDEKKLYHTNSFRYFEIMRMKYLCCGSKKSQRHKQYKQLSEVIAERMDMSSIMTNSGNIDLISNAVLKPYQKRIIYQIQTGKEYLNRSVINLEISTAIDELNHSLSKKQDGRISN